MTAGDDAPAGQHEPASFGSQLRWLRHRAGLSQERLAERAGVSVATIGALEEGVRRRSHPYTVVALADALGLSKDERAGLLETVSRSSTPVLQRTTPSPGHSQRAHQAAPRPKPDLAPRKAQARLPVPPTPLIGRESELEAASAALDPSRSTARLLTLTGPGGVGKTRLAFAVAAALADAYADGVVFVDLAALRDERLVPATIARALEVPGFGGRSARELMLDHLAERQVLLVLDNFEHLVGAAPLLADLLAGCPRLGLLVTSRTVLRLRSEQRVVVGPLATPPDDDLSVEAMTNTAAVRLFVERSRAVAPGFALDASNVQAVAAICRRLEGIPLAIELVAGRADLLTPETLLRRLERGLPLLLRGASDLPDRQQTLQGTLAWSYELLAPQEQRLFRHLAVFAGGWTLEAAEAVCVGDDAAEHAVLDLLGELVDKSLIDVDRTGPEQRYRLLEIVREYAREKLEGSSELAMLQARHASWCVALAERAEAATEQTDAAAWFDRLDRELDNLRTAFAWSEASGDIDAGLRLAGALRWFWDLRGHGREGRYYLERLLARVGPESRTRALAKALNAAGYLAVYQDDLEAARANCEKAAALASELNAADEQAYALRMLAQVAWREGELERAAALFGQALEAYQAVGDQQSIARATISLANVAWMQDRREQAIAGYQDSLVLARNAGLKHETAMALQALGHARLVEGDRAVAADLLRESLELLRELGDKPCGSATIELLACLATTEGRAATAAQWFGIAEKTREVMGRGFALATFRSAYDEGVAAARAALGSTEFDAAWSLGRSLTLDDALNEALA